MFAINYYLNKKIIKLNKKLFNFLRIVLDKYI